MTGHQQSSLIHRAKRIKDELQPHFAHFTIACPYDLPYQAVYNQALFDTMPDFLMMFTLIRDIGAMAMSSIICIVPNVRLVFRSG